MLMGVARGGQFHWCWRCPQKLIAVIGFWLFCNLGRGEILCVKVLGVFMELQLEWNNEIKKIKVESNSALAIQLILDAKVDSHPLESLVLNCRLMHQSWSCETCHIYRENNFVADDLARLGLSCSFGSSLFSKLLLFVVSC